MPDSETNDCNYTLSSRTTPSPSKSPNIDHCITEMISIHNLSVTSSWNAVDSLSYFKAIVLEINK